ncbi:transposase [Pyrenophora tritici-repentis]|uniref:Transposase n=1 Tax=Pyrenophora tritici-repentis TaxID=45151 RepID=A0A922NK58_9PLEO|nr:transposase [Pyrenophora tritici-repentis]
MSQQQNNLPALKEARLQLALKAIERDATLSQRRAAAIYNVSRVTLGRRRAGIPLRSDCTPNSMNLLKTEEDVIVQHILDLDARGFPPRLAAVQDMANSLLAERHRDPVGQNWAATFVKRRPELKVKFNRKYDYKRALCEDPEVIQGWFRLVENTKAKYGILDEDTHNFDESGFMMGMISTGAVVTGSERRGRPKSVQQGNREWATVIQGINATGWAIPPFIIFKGKNHLSAWYKEDNLPRDWVIAVSENGWTTNKLGLEWLKHFDAHTKKRTVGNYRLLIIDGHESHDSLDFQQYCKDHNIITLCMPPHSSHLLQPLDVGCFSPLKTAYGRQAEDLMRNKITHITKLEFLPCFKGAFDAAITKANIQGSFRGAGLVPFNPEAVISMLDVRLRTPLLPTVEDGPWQSQTPSNTLELGSQSKLIQERIRRHVDSSPTYMVEAIKSLSKGAEMIAHSLVLMTKRNAELQAANEASSKRRSYKRKRLQQQGTLTIDEGVRLTTLKEFGACSDRKKAKKRVRVEAGEPSQRRCGRCGEAGHNMRTCRQEAAIDSE